MIILARFLLSSGFVPFSKIDMNDGHLARKLFWIVLIKLAVLFALWWAFIREQRVEVDPATMAQTMQSHNKGEARHGQ